jgi:hypothetical protein
MVEAIKCLVRPVVTYLVILALVGVLVFLVVKFGTLEMAKDVVNSFLILVTAITAFWFGQRTANPPKPPTSPTS